MPQVIKCPHCKNAMQVPDNAAGKTVRCPTATCKQIFAVPSRSGAAQPAATPAATPVAAGASSSAKTSGLSAVGTSEPSTCPACSSKWTEGAIACMDCGYMLQQEQPGGDAGAGAPNLCANDACGVANPPGVRDCQRCGSPLPVPEGEILLGRYRVVKLLKMGGFGAVYKAVDTKQGDREVAIKDMIGSDPQEFKIRLNFFRREAQILKGLEKISIVPTVYDFAEEGQRAQLVMEFNRGKDLLDLMEERGGNKAFPVAQVVQWGISICDVLSYMHNQSPPLIHRDLKAENIMLLHDHKSIKLIDFGTARDLGKTVQERAKKKTVVYTEGYAPPEQVLGKPEARSDLFSLAATLYHLATGEEPNGTFTGQELEAELKSPNCKYPPNERWFYDLIRINLAEDTDDRYYSAKEFKRDLEQQRVTTQIACGKCKTVNEVRVPFCKKCAEPLTEAHAHCNSCGKDNRMGSRFCIYCGNRIR